MSWDKQYSRKPLFEDLLWSRPENKRQAGRLLIVGGQAQNFSIVARNYQAALKAGAGHIRVLLPDSLQKIAKSLPDVEFAPSNKSGSFAKTSLSNLIELHDWAEHTLLAGDFGKNSETTATLDGFLLKTKDRVTLSEDAIKSVSISLKQLVNKDITLVINFDLLQKIGLEAELPKAVTSSLSVSMLAEALTIVGQRVNANIVVYASNHVWVVADKKVSATPATGEGVHDIGPYASVWQMQNPDKIYEALTTSVYELNQ